MKITGNYLIEQGKMNETFRQYLTELQRDNPNRLDSELLLKNFIVKDDVIYECYPDFNKIQIPIEEFTPIYIEDAIKDEAFRLNVGEIMMTLIDSGIFPITIDEQLKILYLAVRENQESSIETKAFEIAILQSGLGCKSVESYNLLAPCYDEYLGKFATYNSIRVREPYTTYFSILPKIYIQKGLNMHATDVYIDALPEGYAIRYTVLGTYYDDDKIPMTPSDVILFLNTIYQMCGEIPSQMMDIRHGSYFMNNLCGNPRYTGRVQMDMAKFGLSFVIRVQDIRKMIGSFEGWEISERNKKNLVRMAQNRSGIILFSGPTGSGKTTAISILIEEIRTHIQTHKRIEESSKPVEYINTNISQVEVQDETGDETIDKNLMTFSVVADSATRRNAQINVPSEVNTPDSAVFVTKLASSDKLVLSTTHTMGAAFIPSRVRILLGEQLHYYEEFLQELKGIQHQLMLKKVCPKCGKFVGLGSKLLTTDQVKVLIHYGFKKGDRVLMANNPNPNCPVCNGLGYLALKPIIIMETLVITNKIRNDICNMPHDKITSYLQSELERNNATEVNDALEYMRKGLVSYDFIWRECGLINMLDDLPDNYDVIIDSLDEDDKTLEVPIDVSEDTMHNKNI